MSDTRRMCFFRKLSFLSAFALCRDASGSKQPNTPGPTHGLGGKLNIRRSWSACPTRTPSGGPRRPPQRRQVRLGFQN